MYELPATYGNLDFVIQKFPWAHRFLGPGASAPSTAHQVLTWCFAHRSGQNWGARNRDQNRIWECKTAAAGSSLEGHRKSYLFFLQNGMRRSELVSGPGRFSKALAFRSRLQWDSILPQTYWPIESCWKVRKPPELIHLWSYGRPNSKSWAFWSHNKLQVPVLAGTWEAWNMDMAVDQD